MAKHKRPKVVVIGGGTGTFTTLTGLRPYQLDLTAVVTMADDGGSNKVLRDEFGLLPTSGIRQSIIALSPKDTTLRQLFNYRYYQGVGISGMTFGNLFMAALADIKGSQKAAIKETCRILGVEGHIYPVSYQPTSLIAQYQDGTEVLGEHAIDQAGPKVRKQRIANLRTIPTIKLAKEARNAILASDLLVLGPGDLYTNTVANLVVQGVPEAIKQSPAKLVFVMNLMSRPGETYRYKASDHLQDLGKYLTPSRLDYVLVNRQAQISAKLRARYQAENSSPVKDDLGSTWQKAQVIRAPMMSSTIHAPIKGDQLPRSFARHDPALLAKAIVALLD